MSLAIARCSNALRSVNNILLANRLSLNAGITSLSAATSENGAGLLDFRTWEKGGGIFHKLASIDPTASVEVGAVVHARANLGARVHVGSGSIIGSDVTIGQSTKIGYNAAISNCVIGESCAIYNGVCIGQDGFGFFVDENGNMIKKPQTLGVKIGNYVDVGANTCIDRGRVAVCDHVSVASKKKMAILHLVLLFISNMTETRQKEVNALYKVVFGLADVIKDFSPSFSLEKLMVESGVIHYPEKKSIGVYCPLLSHLSFKKGQ